jgi:hypothetical protein
MAAVLAGGLGCQREPDPAAPRPVAPGEGEHRVQSTGPRMTITADQVRTWSDALCTLPPLDVSAAPAALGLTGALVPQSSDYATLDPAPSGARRLSFGRENLGDNKGHLGTVEVEPAGAITRGELDQQFGAGNALPRVDYNRPFVISYRVERPGAGFRCTVLASFADEPTAASAAKKIVLRRDVVKPPGAR